MGTAGREIGWQDMKLEKSVGLIRNNENNVKNRANIVSSKKQGSSRKTPNSALLNMPKPLTVWITTNCGKFFKRWEYQTTCPAS